MLDELAGPVFKFIGRVIAYLLIEFFFSVICAFIGRTALRIISLGQYRKLLNLKDDNDNLLDPLVGILLIIGLLIYLVA